MRLLLLLLLLIQAALAAVTFYSKDRKTVYTAPTMDMFELPNRPFNRTKCILAQVKPSIAAPCTFDPAVPLINPTLNSQFVPDYNCTVALLDLLSANFAGCHTINEVIFPSCTNPVIGSN